MEPIDDAPSRAGDVEEKSDKFERDATESADEKSIAAEEIDKEGIPAGR
jgi:hypothetical protein